MSQRKERPAAVSSTTNKEQGCTNGERAHGQEEQMKRCPFHKSRHRKSPRSWCCRRKTLQSVIRFLCWTSFILGSVHVLSFMTSYTLSFALRRMQIDSTEVALKVEARLGCNRGARTWSRSAFHLNQSFLPAPIHSRMNVV